MVTKSGVKSDKPFMLVAKVSGTMTKMELANYLNQLKVFLACPSNFKSDEDKARIEEEIREFTIYKKVMNKVVGHV